VPEIRRAKASFLRPKLSVRAKHLKGGQFLRLTVSVIKGLAGEKASCPLVVDGQASYFASGAPRNGRSKSEVPSTRHVSRIHITGNGASVECG